MDYLTKKWMEGRMVKMSEITEAVFGKLEFAASVYDSYSAEIMSAECHCYNQCASSCSVGCEGSCLRTCYTTSR